MEQRDERLIGIADRMIWFTFGFTWCLIIMTDKGWWYSLIYLLISLTPLVLVRVLLGIDRGTK